MSRRPSPGVRSRAFTSLRKRALRGFLPEVRPLEARQLLSGAPPVAYDSVLAPMLHDTGEDGTPTATDPESDPLTAAAGSGAGPQHGTVIFAGGGYGYTPDPGYVGQDSFSYKVNDGTSDSNDATVTVEVTDVAPVAPDAVYAVPYNQGGDYSVNGNDADFGDTGRLSYSLVSGTTHGTLVYTDGNTSGDFNYTPDAGFQGIDRLTYKISDGAEYSNIATVTLVVAPPTPTVCFTCPDGVLSTAGPGTPPTPSATSSAGINYKRGSFVADPSDFGSAGFGKDWGQDIGWTNIAFFSSGGSNGNGFVNADQPTLLPTGDGGYMAVSTATNVLWFDPAVEGSYTEKFFGKDVLVADGADFKLTDTAGDVFRFYGFDSALPAAQWGRFESFTDPKGNVTSTTYDGYGRIASTSRGDGTTTETYAYAYVSGGVNDGLLSTSTLQRTAGGVTTTVRQVAYTYYDGTQSYGNAGDLELEQVKDGSGDTLDTTYYRYYTAADAGPTGYVGGLKYVFHPQSYARLAAAVAGPTSAADSAVAAYADAYYEYDSARRVSKAVVQGAGCSCSGSDGQGEFTYAYTDSSNADGYNSWKTKTVETLPDGNQNVVYTNDAGEVMFKAFSDVSDAANPANDGSVWATDYRYDDSGRLVLAAQPSAVTITDLGTLNTAESYYSDVVGYSGTSYQYLAAGVGVINLVDYGTSTTATGTTPGDVLGYLKDDKVEQGYAGTPVLLDSVQYLSHADAGGATVYPQAASTVYRNADGTGAETTSYDYTWFTGTNQVQSLAVSAPVVSSSQNGPGAADVTTTFYDTYGRPTWTKDGDGFIHYTAYDDATGAVTKSIADVDTSLTGEFSGLPSGWSTPSGGGLNLVTTYQVDGMGRTTKEVDPNGNVTYTVYDDPDHEVRTYRGWDATAGLPTGPTLVTREDRAGSYTETLTMSAAPAVSGTAGSYVPTGTEAVSGLQTLSRTYTDTSGRTAEVDQYFSLTGVTYSTATYPGTAGTNYYATKYGYDETGRLSHVVDPNGTITDTYYDALGRPVSTYVGTTSSTTPSEEWSSGHTGMTLVSQNQYDGNGVGDGNLTQTTEYPDATASDDRVTQYAYDGRDRLLATKSGVQATEDTTTGRPITFYDRDNLGEVTAVSRYDGDGVTLTGSKPGASLLRAYAVTNFDDQGRAYQTLQYGVDPSTGSVSTYALTRNTYYDHRGDTVAVSAPGGLWTKYQYDGAGRLVTVSQTDGASGTTWSDASSVAGDHVLSQTLTTYDGDGNPTLVTTKDRFDDDTSSDTGALGDPSTGPEARVSYVANYYDAADRRTATVDVGTNGGAAYTRPGTAPSRSDTVLVTSDAYNAAGWVESRTDPRGIVTRTAYDALGRPTQVIADYDVAVALGEPTDSANQTTDYTYDGLGHTTSVVVVMPSGTPSQTTAFVYGVTTAGGSGVNSNDLLATTENPDPTTGDASTSVGNQTSYQYNALGQKVGLTDPNGTAHTYAYDVLGRQTGDAVTTLGTGVDGAVRRLTTAYDSAGNPYLYTSYDAASGGSVVNQVEDVFNGLGQLTGEYQEQGGAVDTSTSPEVQYAYTEMSGGQNNSRLTSMTYPNGRVVDDVYNSGLDSAVSRLSALADDSGGTPGTTLESYDYLGLGTIVARHHPEPGVDLTYVQQSGDSAANTDGGDRYTGLDRFGRVIDQNWVDTGTGAAVARVQYGYDRGGNVTSRDDLVDAALSQLYSYDALNRLSGFTQGTLSGGTISSPTSSQSWALDALGNWAGVTTDSTTVSRSFNTQNQATSVTSGTAPTFDAGGNTTGDSAKTYVYDAWNRLAAVKNSGGTTVAAYAYDALGRRVSETYSGTSTTNHLYYSPQWQVIEERQNGTAASNVSQQYVWSPAGIDTLVLRDSYSGGSISQRLYALQDANQNMTALVGTTGTVEERYAYDPYGDVTVRDAGGSPRTGNASSYGWQYLHQGGRLDQVTGWYGFRHRDYVPGEGRWAEKDPWGFNGGDTNLYRFVGNGPIDLVDPVGEDAWGAAGGAVDGGLLGGGSGFLIGAGIGSIGGPPGALVGGAIGGGIGLLGGSIWGGINGSSETDFLNGTPQGVVPGAVSGVGGGLVGGTGGALLGPAITTAQAEAAAASAAAAAAAAKKAKALKELNECWNQGSSALKRPIRGGGTGNPYTPPSPPTPPPPVQPAPPMTTPTPTPTQPTWTGLGPPPKPVPGINPGDLNPQIPPTTGWWPPSWWPF